MADQKMKVLLISPLPPPVGGIATVTENLIRYLESDPVTVDLELCNTTNKFRSITSQSFLLRIYTGFYNSVRTLFDVRKTIKNEMPDLIHLASSSSFALFKDYVIAWIARHYKIPIIIHWHFGRIPFLADKHNWEWKLLKFVIRSCTVSIVIDPKSYSTLRKAGFTNIVNIPNPLALDIEQKSRVLCGKSIQRQQGRMIFVGHIVRSKGVFELVEACSQLPSIKELSLIGPCEENVKKELRALAGKRDNGDWLNIIGELIKDQVLEHMFFSPVLVLPSYTEGFPNAVLEGMAMGCAIIATDVGAIPEMLNVQSEKPCGICVPPHHVEELKDAISELMQDHSRIEVMGKNGVERVLNNYAIKKIAEQYISLWENAVNRNLVLKTNVLLVSPLPPPVGGIASWTPNIIKYYANSDCNVKLTILNSALKGKSITSSSLIKRYYSGIYNFLWINFEFRKLIRGTKPSLVHLVSSSSLALYKDYLLIGIAKKLKIPVIMHWRFGRIPSLAVQRNWEWKLLKYVIKRSAVSIVIDSRSYSILRNAGFTNVVYIPNPLGLDIEHKSRTLLGKPNQRQPGRLIFVGHIVRSKGVYELVEACSQLPLIRDLLLIGPCEENVKKELRALANKRENGVWLKLIGELNKDQVLEHMFNSPVLVLPSYTEGFPNAVLEGMAMGCAIVATDVGAIPEMLDVESNKPCGICVPPQHVEKLKEAILELSEDPSKMNAMSNHGIERVLNNYTMKKIAEQYRMVWEDVTDEGSLFQKHNNAYFTD
jgi:glycosyltransferase involved in cell wall biosynthesis